MGGEGGTTPRLVGGRYALEHLLGQGGMSEVWRARHIALNSHVAIKFLHGGSAAHESSRKRFLNEAQITAQLKSRHAVQVFDFGVDEGDRPYLVMEHLDGETLARRIRRLGRLSPAITVATLMQAARAIDRAHALGIVHRDLKPENMFITVDEEGREYLKVVDFGIAKLIGDLGAEPFEAHEQESGHAMLASFTRTGTTLGTPLYMAPEQVRNAPDLGPAADVWALGVVAFECLTGQPPFDGVGLRELFDRIESGARVDPFDLNAGLPRAFDPWFAEACAHDPARRFPSATVAVRALAEALDLPAASDANPIESLVAPPGPSSEEVSIAEGFASTKKLIAAGHDEFANTEAAPAKHTSKNDTTLVATDGAAKGRRVAVALVVLALAMAPFVVPMIRKDATPPPPAAAAVPASTRANVPEPAMAATERVRTEEMPVPQAIPSVKAPATAQASTRVDASSRTPTRASSAVPAASSASAAPPSSASPPSPPPSASVAPASAPKPRASSAFELPPLGL